VAAFTAVVGIAVASLAEQAPSIRAIVERREAASLPARWFGLVLGAGFAEEAAEALPVSLFVYREPRAYRPPTFVYVGVVSGPAFGVVEAVGDSYRYAEASRAVGPELIDDYVAPQLPRPTSLPLPHACRSAVVGDFIGLASVSRAAPRALMGLGLSLAALLHGTYDAFVGGGAVSGPRR